MGTNVDADSIEITMMGIREALMNYFKGTCIDYVTNQAGINLVSGYSSSYNFRYEQRQRENQRFSILLLGDTVPIFAVQKAPDKIIYYTDVLNRSKQLRQAHQMIDEFMRRYLGAVEREEQHGSVCYR